LYYVNIISIFGLPTLTYHDSETPHAQEFS